MVFKARHKHDYHLYAVKRIAVYSAEEMDQMLKEVRVLAKLDHNNIIRAHQGWQEVRDQPWRESLSLSKKSRSVLSDSNVQFEPESRSRRSITISDTESNEDDQTGLANTTSGSDIV